MHVGFPWCLRASLSFAAATTVGVFTHKIYVQQDVRHKAFVRGYMWIGQWMPYNSAADRFHTKKLCRRLSSKQVHFYTENGHFAFLSLPPLGSVEVTYAVHLRLIGKLLVEFLLVIIELFFVRSKGWGAELISIRNCRFWSGGGLYAQNLRSMGHPPQTICAQLVRPVNSLQLCHCLFAHKETL